MLKKKGKTMTEEEVRDLVEHLLSSAFQQHGRELEKHLKDIHERLVKVEERRN